MRRNPPARRPSVARRWGALAACACDSSLAPPPPLPPPLPRDRPQQARRRQGRCQGRQGRQGQDRCLSPRLQLPRVPALAGPPGAVMRREVALRGCGSRPHMRYACADALRERLCVVWMLTNADAQPARDCLRIPARRHTIRALEAPAGWGAGLSHMPELGRAGLVWGSQRRGSAAARVDTWREPEWGLGSCSTVCGAGSVVRASRKASPRLCLSYARHPHTHADRPHTPGEAARRPGRAHHAMPRRE